MKSIRTVTILSVAGIAAAATVAAVVNTQILSAATEQGRNSSESLMVSGALGDPAIRIVRVDAGDGDTSTDPGSQDLSAAIASGSSADDPGAWFGPQTRNVAPSQEPTGVGGGSLPSRPPPSSSPTSTPSPTDPSPTSSTSPTQTPTPSTSPTQTPTSSTSPTPTESISETAIATTTLATEDEPLPSSSGSAAKN